MLPLDISLDATSSDCSNNPGPWITLEGELALGSVTVELVFRNNDNPVGGPHENRQETTSEVVVLEEGETLSIPKQPVRGGTGGNPFIWVQFVDASGDAVSDEIYLGRCVQGFDETLEFSMSVPMALAMDVTEDSDSCSNNPGPWITLEGEMSLGGLNALIIFRNNDNPVGGPHSNIQQTTAEIEILEDGETLSIPKQPVLGGVGGNPFVWVAVATADEGTGEIYLGRCVQDL